MIYWITALLLGWILVLTVEVIGLRRDIAQLDGEIERLNIEATRRRK